MHLVASKSNQITYFVSRPVVYSKYDCVSCIDLLTKMCHLGPLIHTSIASDPDGKPQFAKVNTNGSTSTDNSPAY